MFEVLKYFAIAISGTLIVGIAFAVIISLKGFLEDSDRPIFQFIYSGLKIILIIALLFCVIIAPFAPDEEEVRIKRMQSIVYMIEDDECYHRYSCAYVQNSDYYETTLDSAMDHYLVPCDKCKPIEY